MSRLLAVASATTMLVVVPGTGVSSGSAFSPTGGRLAPAPIAKLVSQSHKEGGLTIYGNAPAPYFTPVITAFEHLYPWINVQDYDLSDNQVFSKYESEHAQGARSADLLISSGPGLWVQAERNGLVQNVTPQGLTNFPASTNQGHGVFIMSPEPILSAYNEKLLTASEVPTTYAQLVRDVTANPAKFKLVSYPITNPLAYGAVYGLIHILGAKTVWSDLKVLGPNTKTFNEGLDGLQYMVQGGASIGYISSGLSQGVLPHFQGLANYVFMADATPLIPRGIGMAAGASNPASAQLFMDFLFSGPGQQALCGAGFEASENGFTPTNSCTASLTQLYKMVPPSRVYLVPFSADLLRQQASITARWNRAFHLGS
ncbi:MAG: ABC transporter substrate-binding protein [Acidimicrobiales bacterium]